MRLKSLCPLLLSSALLLGCGGGGSASLVTKEPPPPQEEVRLKQPGTDVFWQPGHWAWNGEQSQFYWVAGSWEREREGFFWLPGYWESVDEAGAKGWRWTEARWARTEELDDPPPR